MWKRIQGWTPVRFVLRIAQLWSTHAVPRHSASVAFFTMLTLAPLLMVLAGVAGLFLGSERVVEQILTTVRTNVGEQASRAIETLIEQTVLRGSGASATIFGVLLAMWGASGLLHAIKDSLDRFWDAPPHSEVGIKNWLITRLIGAGAVLFLSLLLVASVVLDIVLATLHRRLGSEVPAFYWLGLGLNRSLTPILLTLGTAILYWWLPGVRVRFRYALVGAFVYAMLWMGARALISLYISTSGLATLYGSAGSVVALLIWVYISAHLFFLGALITVALQKPEE